MNEYGTVKKRIDSIIGMIRGYMRQGQVKVYVHTINTLLGSDYKQVAYLTSINNETRSEVNQREANVGDQLPERILEVLNEHATADNTASIQVTIRNGSGNDMCDPIEIPLIDKYQPRNLPVQHAEPKPEPPADNGASLINDLLGQALSGLGGVQGSGLGAIFGIRDQLVATNYEKERIRDEYERRDLQRQLAEAQQKCIDYERRIDEMSQSIRNKDKEIDRYDDKVYQLEEELSKLEKLKPENSIAGVALTGVLASAGERLLMKHAGALGKLMGVSKEDMLGMLTGTNEQMDAPTAQPSEPAKVSEADLTDNDNPRASQTNSILTLVNSMDDDEFQAFWTVALYLDENRDKLIEFGRTINSQQS